MTKIRFSKIYLILFCILLLINKIGRTQCDPPINIQLLDYGYLTCHGASDGYLLIEVTGGTPPYFYNWSTGGNDTLETNLGHGYYTIVVSDVLGCSDTATFFIEEPAPIQISFETTDIKCHGSEDGTITVNASGGVGGFSYEWLTEPALYGKTINNLSPGIYPVLVTDQNGCSSIDSAKITEPASTTILIEKSDVTCYGDENAVININASGGAPPFYFAIDQGMYQTSSIFAGLGAGNYLISIMDKNGCEKKLNVEINEPSPLDISIDNKQDLNCFGESNGIINFHATGGSPPYSYYLNFFKLDSSFIDTLSAGNYSIIVNDSIGCSYEETFEIIQPDSIFIDIPETDTLHFGESIEIQPDYFSNSANPEFNWFPEYFVDCITCPDPTLSPIQSTKYYVRLTDEETCVAIDSITIVVIPEKKIFIPNAFTPNGDGLNDVFNIVTMGVQDFTMQIFDKWGTIVFESNDINMGWPGDYQGNVMPTDAYFYKTKIIYLDKEIVQKKGLLNLIR